MDQTHSAVFGNRRRSTANDAEVLQQARSLVEQFVDYLSQHPVGGAVVDDSELPCPRDTLITCVRLTIATESRPHVRENLRIAGLSLAQFQEGIGERMSLRPVKSGWVTSSEKLDALTLRHRCFLERFDRAFQAIAPERTRLDRLFRDAIAMAEARQGSQPAPESDDTASPAYH